MDGNYDNLNEPMQQLNSQTVEVAEKGGKKRAAPMSEKIASSNKKKWCVPCSKSVKLMTSDAWSLHVKGNAHSKNLGKKASRGNSRVPRYIAPQNATRVESNSTSVSSHAVTELRNIFERNLVKALKEKPQLSIKDQVLLFESTLQMDQVKIAQQQGVIQILETLLADTFPGCRLVPFGSTVSGLASFQSDLDAYLHVPLKSADGSLVDSQGSWAQQKERSIQLLDQAFEKLCVHPEFVNVVFISKTRIPLLKVVHSPTGISCDISSNNEKAKASSDLVRALLSVEPNLVKPFVFFLINWAKCNKLIGAYEGNLSCYGICLLAIFYCQLREILPTVESLQEGVAPIMCNNWNTSFKSPEPLKSPTAQRPSLLQLLIGFFNFFHSFKSNVSVISPLKGRILPASDFRTAPITKSKSVLEPPSLSQPSPFRLSGFNLQEPFELNQNVSFGFSNFKNFKLKCKESELLCLQMSDDNDKLNLLSLLSL